MSQPGEHGPAARQANPPGKVGYCHPPEEHRFKKGVSGNPKGRPKRPVDAGYSNSEFSQLVSKEANKRIQNGQGGTVPLSTAILRTLAVSALKGDVAASRVFLQHASRADQTRLKQHQRRFDRQVAYKRRAAMDIHRDMKEGFQPLEFVPHPDDMVIDFKHERVIINGPADDVEKAEWDASEAERQELVESIANLRGVLTGPDEGLRGLYQGSRALVLELLEETKDELAALDAKYPSKEQRRQPGNAHKPCRQQQGDGEPAPVSHPDADVAETAGDARGGYRQLLNRFEQSKTTLAQIDKDLLSNSGPFEGTSTEAEGATTPAEGEERKALVLERRKLKRRSTFLERQLRGPEETLDPQFETHMCVSFELKSVTERLIEIDERLTPRRRRR